MQTAMANRKQVEDAMHRVEGFRVEFELLDSKRASLPEYDWSCMAPQRWKISDWKNQRLTAYRDIAKGVIVFRGDGTPVARDMQLGNLRDSYYEAGYGPAKLEPEPEYPANVVQMAERRRSKRR